MTGRGKKKVKREREKGALSAWESSITRAVAYAWLASQRWKVHRARERLREAQLCSSRGEPQSPLVGNNNPIFFFFFVSLSNHCATRPAYILTLLLAMCKRFALDLFQRRSCALKSFFYFQEKVFFIFQKFRGENKNHQIISWEWNWLGIQLWRNWLFSFIKRSQANGYTRWKHTTTFCYCCCCWKMIPMFNSWLVDSGHIPFNWGYYV